MTVMKNLQAGTSSPEPLVSAVIPAYGVEEYLASCLTSVLEMDTLLEALVVIDASPDLSGFIAHQFARMDPRVRVIENATNLGLGASRNVGATQARGRYVIFIDSDDVVVPGVLDAMVATLERTGSDFATACADEFGRTSARTRYWTTTRPIFRTGAEGVNLRDAPELIEDHTAWTKLFRRSFWTTQQLAWPEQTKCEDVACSAKAYTLAEKIDVIPRVSYLYRRRPGSITTALTDERTLRDWAQQSVAALEVVLAREPRAAQYMLAKVLLVEARSRLSSILGMSPGDALDDVRHLLRAAVSAANEDITAQLSPEILGLAGPAGRDSVITSSSSDSDDRDATGQAGGRLTSGSPMLSVVMPTHNVADYVEDAIRSITTQSFTDFELIIVDDRSTDGTLEIARSWADRDPRVHVYENPGSGGAQARNFGIQVAAGLLLGFADGDDLVPQQAYSSLVRTLLHNDADMAIGDFQKFWPTSTWRNSAQFGLNAHVAATTLEARPKLIANRTCWNRIFRLSYWHTQRLHFPTTARANDILPMTVAMRNADRISVVPEVVYHYRARTGSGSMTSALGQIPSIIGYFRQEAMCSVAIDTGPSTLLSREYWRTALGVDGWGNLGRFLTSIDTSTPREDLIEVSEAIDGLWRRFPREQASVLSAEQILCYRRAAEGDFDSASVLWRAHSVADGKTTRADAISVLAALRASHADGEGPDAILRTYHDHVLRAVLDDRSRWNEATVRHISHETIALASSLDLRESAVPESPEQPLVDSLLEGDTARAWRVARGIQGPRALQASLRDEPWARRVTVSVGPIEGSEGAYQLVWTEVVGRKQPGALGRRFSLPIIEDESRTRSLIITGDTLRHLEGRTWKVSVSSKHMDGEIPVTLSTRNDRRASHLRANGSTIQFLHSGPQRVARAIRWRLQRAEKLRRGRSRR